MKKIFRYSNIGLLLAAFIAFGTAAGYAQDACADADGQTKLGDSFRAQFALKDLPSRKSAIDTGKQFLEKYGSCETAKDLADYLTKELPGIEQRYKATIAAQEEAALTKRFDAALTAKNWNEVYVSGKEIVAKYPDKYRDVVLVLGSVGLDETAKTPRVTTWNEDTLRYAKQAIADLEAGKAFKTFGVAPFTYKNKEDALGWMNYTIGYINFFGKNDKKQGLSYLYKATQLNSETKSNPIVFQSIGSYYFDDVKKLADEVTAMSKLQNPDDTAEVAQQKIDAIKAKVALVNGTAEAAIDAYARAYKLADPTPKGKAYKDSLYKIISDLYNVRFGKTTGIDAFIASTTAKPMPNPLNPVTPISDPDPTTTTTTTSGTSAGIPSGTGIGNVSGNGIGNPSGTGIGNISGNGIGNPSGGRIGGAKAPVKPSTTAKPAGPVKP